MLNSDLSAMLSQHYVMYDVNVVITSCLPERSFFDWQISHAYFCFVSAFCFTCKHAEMKLKQNNFTETKHCFAFVLFQFYFSYNHGFSVGLRVIKASATSAHRRQQYTHVGQLAGAGVSSADVRLVQIHEVDWIDVGKAECRESLPNRYSAL